MLNFNFGIGILIFAYDATPMVNIVKKSLSGSIMARQVVCRLMSSPVVNRRPSYDVIWRQMLRHGDKCHQIKSISMAITLL